MIVVIGTGDCPKCRTLRNRLEELQLGCVYLDAVSLRNGEYGAPTSHNDPRLDGMVALVMQNLTVPVLLVDGVRQDVAAWMESGADCTDGVCRVA
ncbi:MAG: hypothetical protein JW909_01615 [Planctomycetes bacterium]|nr:hypothetical protein [Planctomycetota bacterium]